MSLPKAPILRNDEGALIPDRVDEIAYGLLLAERVDRLLRAVALLGMERVATALPLTPSAAGPVGSGPFRFDSYEAGERLVLGRNREYFGAEVRPSRVLMEFRHPDSAFLDGSADWLIGMDPETRPALSDRPDALDVPAPHLDYNFFTFNMRPGMPFADRRLRQAFSLCIDRDVIVARAFGPAAVAVDGPYPAGSWMAASDGVGHRFDQEEGRRLIESAGWTRGVDGVYERDGERLEADIWIRPGRTGRVFVSILAAEDLRECGFESETMEADIAYVLGPEPPFPGWMVDQSGWSTDVDPDQFPFFHSSQIPPDASARREPPPLLNYPAWSNPEADRLLEAGRRELDAGQRRQIYGDFQALLAEEVPYVFLWSDKVDAAISSRIGSPSGGLDLESPLDDWNVETWVIAPAP